MPRRVTTPSPHHTFRKSPTTRPLPYSLTACIPATQQGRGTRICIAVETFLDLFLDHQRVLDLYTRWEHRYKLYRSADDVYHSSVLLAKDLNVPDVFALNLMGDLGILTDETQRWFDRREAAATRFQQVIKNLPIKAMVKQARIVIEQIFTRAIQSRIGQLAPDLGHVLLQRWTANAARAVDGKFQFSIYSTKREGMAPGREPRKKRDSIKRNVTWWFRRVLNGESIGKLAREYHQKVHAKHKHHWKNDKATIHDGIEQAEALLRESPLFEPMKSHKS